MIKESMLTTFDNPYDPFTEWVQWYHFDESHGYSTSGLLARIAVVADELPYHLQRLSIEQAIDEILQEDVEGIYKKVSRMIEAE